ncbi:MAG: hypothetical protein M1831_005735 [Alyxoria varia]|nr:MAG: hypothetical protein M1831_005735 [Alyxoria varia]
MAGNPFRRNREENAPASISLPPRDPALPGEVDSQDAADTDRRVSSVKRVRIQTPPPLSPDPETPLSDDTSIHRVAFESHPGSPPPIATENDAVRLSSSDGNSDPFSRSFEEDNILQEALENTRRNSTTNVIPSDLGRKVLNPFQKTLATIESSEDRGEANLNNSQDRQSKDITPAFEKDVSEKKGSAMDVDAFTRMLMTGKRDAQASRPAAPEALSGQNFGLSRRSESSRFSYETSETGRGPGTKSLQNVDPKPNQPQQRDETLLPPKRAETKKSKPPPPQHHRGKSLSQTKPQDAKSSKLEENVSTAALESRSTRKELPPLPQSAKSSRATSDSSASEKASLDTESNISENQAPSLEYNPGEQSKSGSKRPRPPAPLARKSSHRIPTTQMEWEKHEGNLAQTSLSSPQTSGRAGYTASRKAPPPPPSRRQAPKGYAPSEHSSISESASIGSDSTAQIEEFPSLDNRSIIASGVHGSSRSSSISEKNPPIVSPSMASPVPPPPPPRRRRGSSRNSGDSVPPPNRVSSDEKRTSSDIPRSGSESFQRASGLTQVPEGDDGNKGSSQNVLADLTALQEEVEALRKNYTKAS